MDDLLNGVKTQNVDFTPIGISTKIKEMFQSAGAHMTKNKWLQDSRSNGRKCQKFAWNIRREDIGRTEENSMILIWA